MIVGKTLTAPSNAYFLVYNLQFNGSPLESDIVIQANDGSEFKEYDEYKIGITTFNGYPIGGNSAVPADLVQRVEDVESEVADLQEAVSGLTNEGLIADLPLSDGTGIEQGYAYIDNTTGVVKVKLS